MSGHTIFDVRCPLCGTNFELCSRPWCRDPKPSKICPACESCACSLPGYENPLFWKEAPLALRREGISRLFLFYL